MAKKILFIDSDEAFASGLLQAASSRGHVGLVASNSEQGIDTARHESPDLIVVCVEAQPTNGYMLCTRLKKDDRLKSIPVILTSSNATPDSFEKHKKLKTRAEDYLIKPFQPPALFEKVNRLLGLPAEEGAQNDEPLGLGMGLVAGEDEPIQISDHELVSGGDDGFLVDEVEEVVQVDEQSASAEGDPDLQMFDRAFEALEMPGAKPDQHEATTPIAQAPEHHEGVVHLSQEAAHEAQTPSPAPAEKSIDDILGSLDSQPEASASDNPAAEWEARLHQLEQDLAARTAELEAARAQSGSSADLLKLKEQRNKQDREILRLKDELQGKERDLLDLQDSQTQLEAQVQQQKDEAIKREAAAKALQQRAEALAAAAKKFERELTAAREELKGAQALKAKVLELEKSHAELRGKHDGAQGEIDKAQQKVAAIQAELEGVKEMHAAELTGARELHQNEVQQLRGELTVLHDDLRKGSEEVNAARAEHQQALADVQRLTGDLEAVRAELTAATGERELLREEREELRGKLAAAEALSAQNEERAVKAYGRIKNDERLRERTRKALQIALQLLDEQPSLEAVEESQLEAAKSA